MDRLTVRIPGDGCMQGIDKPRKDGTMLGMVTKTPFSTTNSAYIEQKKKKDMPADAADDGGIEGSMTQFSRREVHAHTIAQNSKATHVLVWTYTSFNRTVSMPIRVEFQASQGPFHAEEMVLSLNRLQIDMDICADAKARSIAADGHPNNVTFRQIQTVALNAFRDSAKAEEAAVGRGSTVSEGEGSTEPASSGTTRRQVRPRGRAEEEPDQPEPDDVDDAVAETDFVVRDDAGVPTYRPPTVDLRHTAGLGSFDFAGEVMPAKAWTTLRGVQEGSTVSTPHPTDFDGEQVHTNCAGHCLKCT